MSANIVFKKYFFIFVIKINNKTYGKKDFQSTFNIGNIGKYEGGLINGKREGLGTIEWQDGQKYIGEWKNDKMDGRGTYIWSDKKKYTGDWKDNYMDGLGELKSDNGIIFNYKIEILSYELNDF